MGLFQELTDLLREPTAEHLKETPHAIVAAEAAVPTEAVIQVEVIPAEILVEVEAVQMRDMGKQGNKI